MTTASGHPLGKKVGVSAQPVRQGAAPISIRQCELDGSKRIEPLPRKPYNESSLGTLGIRRALEPNGVPKSSRRVDLLVLNELSSNEIGSGWPVKSGAAWSQVQWNGLRRDFFGMEIFILSPLPL
jgi:hypothetical protein